MTRLFFRSGALSVANDRQGIWHQSLSHTTPNKNVRGSVIEEGGCFNRIWSQFPMLNLIGSMKIWFESRTTLCFLSLQSHELLLFERFPVDWPCFAVVLLRIEIIVLYESIKWRVSMVGGGGYQGESDHQFNPAMAPFWELGVRGGIYTWDWQIEVIIIVICLSSWDSLYLYKGGNGQ